MLALGVVLDISMEAKDCILIAAARIITPHSDIAGVITISYPKDATDLVCIP